jgi:hypothetical protein
MHPDDLCSAIDAALAGRWDEAHAIVQRDEADPTAAWIHAVLHRIEGDAGNARYWYGVAGRPVGTGDPDGELRTIRATLHGTG